MTGRILVVDDILANLKLLEARLSAEYFDVFTAENGAQALDVLARERVDLVLLDVMMPGLNGFDVCRRIKASPATMHVPVVLLTALDQPDDKLKGLEAGADDFLSKTRRGACAADARQEPDAIESAERRDDPAGGRQCRSRCDGRCLGSQRAGPRPGPADRRRCRRGRGDHGDAGAEHTVTTVADGRNLGTLLAEAHSMS